MLLEQIRAQDSAIRTLKAALVSGRVPHAYLFSGPSGVGKHLAARALSMALNCQSRVDDGCLECLSCRKIRKGVHPDFIEMTLPEKKKYIPVDAVRKLERRLAIPPHEGKALSVVIDPADRMSEAASNALLKTLEEPRPGRFLILVTSRMSSMLATVRSRCQVVRFGSVPEATISDLLSSGGVAPEEAATAAAFSGGSIERAQSYLGADLERRIDSLLRLLESATETTPSGGLTVIDELRESRDNTRGEVLALLDLAPVVLSELMWMATHEEAQTGDSVLQRKYKERLRKVASEVPISRIADFASSIHRVVQAIEINNLNPQAAMEDVLTSMRGRDNRVSTGSGFR